MGIIDAINVGAASWQGSQHHLVRQHVGMQDFRQCLLPQGIRTAAINLHGWLAKVVAMPQAGRLGVSR